MIRTRRDVANLTLADAAEARTQEWHPVLDTYAHRVRLMDRLGEADPRSWLWAANTHSGRARRGERHGAAPGSRGGSPRDPDAQAHRAGRVSTFGLAGTPETEERSYAVDLSSVLPDLLAEGWSGGQLSVRLVPDEGAADSADDGDRSIHVRQVTVYLQRP